MPGIAITETTTGKIEKQTLRRALFAEVKALQATGLNINQVRLRLNCHHTTAARFFNADEYPADARQSLDREVRRTRAPSMGGRMRQLAAVVP